MLTYYSYVNVEVRTPTGPGQSFLDIINLMELKNLKVKLRSDIDDSYRKFYQLMVKVQGREEELPLIVVSTSELDETEKMHEFTTSSPISEIIYTHPRWRENEFLVSVEKLGSSEVADFAKKYENDYVVIGSFQAAVQELYSCIEVYNKLIMAKHQCMSKRSNIINHFSSLESKQNGQTIEHFQRKFKKEIPFNKEEKSE